MNSTRIFEGLGNHEFTYNWPTSQRPPTHVKKKTKRWLYLLSLALHLNSWLTIENERSGWSGCLGQPLHLFIQLFHILRMSLHLDKSHRPPKTKWSNWSSMHHTATWFSFILNQPQYPQQRACGACF